MIAVDTNILARAIAEEADADAATLRQQRQARALLSSGQPLFVPVTVVVELEWVLRGAYGMAAADIAAVLEDLLAVEGLNVDRAAALAQALQGYLLLAGDWCRNSIDIGCVESAATSAMRTKRARS